MKKNLLAIFALVLGLSLSAFTTVESQRSSNDPEFFLFIGNPQNPADLTDDQKYIAGEDDPGCNGGQTRCGVYASPKTGDTDHPDLSAAPSYVNWN